MTTEPKLFTAADIAWLERETDPRDIIRIIRERGLIAPEPVDPLLIEAREIVASQSPLPEQFRSGELDSQPIIIAVLAALRRGMEMRTTLTREMVGRAFATAAALPVPRTEAYYGITIDRLHTALTEALQ